MLRTYSTEEITSLTALRTGETKIGETIHTLGDLNHHIKTTHKIQYAILGIEEDLGVRANNGIGGANTAWRTFLNAFLNIQDNQFLNGHQFIVFGAISNLATVEDYDEIVFQTCHQIIAKGWIPIVIGGGHNNAYPLLKALSNIHQMPINCINIDPHADLRSTETRHSGNGFSFAKEQNYLDKYALVGLHQSYNNQYILDKFNQSSDYRPIWWEDIFLKESYTWTQAIQQGLYFVADQKFGVELDLDAIVNTLSSAMTPVGIDTQQACQALYMIGMHPNASYLHLPEGILERVDGLKQNTIGKLLAYLVTSFIKGKIES